jgi:hypothetical protein
LQRFLFFELVSLFVPKKLAKPIVKVLSCKNWLFFGTDRFPLSIPIMSFHTSLPLQKFFRRKKKDLKKAKKRSIWRICLERKTLKCCNKFENKFYRSTVFTIIVRKWQMNDLHVLENRFQFLRLFWFPIECKRMLFQKFSEINLFKILSVIWILRIQRG